MNFYLPVSEQYVLKAGNELCSNAEIIDQLDECKLAIKYLKDRGVDVTLTVSTESESNWPKGCYKHNPSKPANGYFNTHSSGHTNSHGQPICKKGELINSNIANSYNSTKKF